MSDNTKNNKTALVIAPHHDDEVIGAGGTMLYLINRGYDIKVAHVFYGSSGITGVKTPQKSHAIRENEAKKAAKNAGYQVLPNLGFIDRNRDNDAKLQSSLIKLIRSVNPVIVFLPSKEETDYEHRLVSKEGREALWLSASGLFPELGTTITKIPTVFYYEVWKNISSPTIYCDITSFMGEKKAMLKVFSSQMETSGWVDGAIGLNAYRGATTLGGGYAEVFGTEKIYIGDIL